MKEEDSYEDKDKDKDKDKENKKPFGDDPPIIVGGGGSAFIWIRKNQTITFVADPTTIHNGPKHPDQYHVLKVDANITAVDADDGKGNGPGSHAGHSAMDKDKFRTAFE